PFYRVMLHRVQNAHCSLAPNFHQPFPPDRRHHHYYLDSDVPRRLQEEMSLPYTIDLASPPLSHRPACLLGTARFQSTSSLQSKIGCFGFDQADALEPTQGHASVGLWSVG